jgi:hypothetical protein
MECEINYFLKDVTFLTWKELRTIKLFSETRFASNLKQENSSFVLLDAVTKSKIKFSDMRDHLIFFSSLKKCGKILPFNIVVNLLYANFKLLSLSYMVSSLLSL